jgi:hypothetical protein
VAEALIEVAQLGLLLELPCVIYLSSHLLLEYLLIE